MPAARRPLLVATALLALILTLGYAAPASAGVVRRAIGIPTLATFPADERTRVLGELAGPLAADTLRIDLFWNLAEPSRGAYDDDGYLAQIDATVSEAHDLGLAVIVTVYRVPRWASDSAYWSKPPSTAYQTGTYQSFYPMKQSALADFQAFAEHLATRLSGKVLGYECWNEPNLWPYLYPQQIGGDGGFASTTYLNYLKAFSAGVRAGDPAAQVIAGATAPGGGNDIHRTSPQRFARLLSDKGAGAYFDVYSHHPYTVGGSTDYDPASPPSRPDVLVNLGNISTLLGTWPSKPFYLTEYGYNTEYTYAFSYAVSQVVQARYLRKAYAIAARYPQIEMLVWWEIQDRSSGGASYSPSGIYTGLRSLDGDRKRAWFAFAGDNLITLKSPSLVAPGTSVRLQGTYTCSTIGGVAGRVLLLQRKWGRGSWKTLRTVTTGDNGYYKTFVTPKRASRYRLVFDGVVASEPVLVRIR